MNRIKIYSLLFPTSVVVLFFVIGSCHNGSAGHDNVITRDLTVKNVSDTMFISQASSDSIIGWNYELGAEVDMPIDGPQPLYDSVRWFITKDLYDMFELEALEEKKLVPLEKVCKWNGDNIVTDFIRNYSPLYEKSEMGTGAEYLTLKLVAQTSTFVTYYGEYTICGGSCNYGYGFYTFRKRDGHQLHEIVNTKKMKKFLKNNKKYRDLIIVESDDEYVGMMDNGLLYAYRLYGTNGGFLEEMTIPYAEIKSYLTKDAQELIPDD